MSRPPTVLQTYTIPLTMVKRDMESWIEPIKAEYNQLVYESQAVKPVKLSELEAMEGYQDMELAPSKLVTTVKSPNGKHKARIVICGNLVTKAHEDGSRPKAASVPAADLYAGGADATAIRCMVRKTALMEGWDMGVVDIKGAFLLAPRRRERECLMMTIPPKLLVQVGICPPDERWVIQRAMYGLETSPADWSDFRDRSVKRADFLTKPITVGATWSRFRRFAGLYDMAEPEDLETLKKIGICREWALKGLTVAVELERWKPTTEEHHRIRRLGICAVAAGVCHVVQRWKSHLCCLKRKSRTPRENEPGIGTQLTETRWPRENEPGPNHQLLRENEPSIKKTLKPQSPTSFGNLILGNRFLGITWLTALVKTTSVAKVHRFSTPV